MSMTSSLDRPPIAEIAKRTAEAGGGLAAAVHGAAVINAVRAARDYAQRVKDSHRIEMKMAGLEQEEQADHGDDDMGDINLVVTGDLYGNEAVKSLATQPTGQAEQAHVAVQPPNGGGVDLARLARTIGPYILAAVAGFGGYIAGHQSTPPAIHEQPPPQTQAASPDRWMEYDIQKWTPSHEDKP